MAKKLATKCDRYMVTLQGTNVHGGYMTRDRVRIAYSAYLYTLVYALFAQINTVDDLLLIKAPIFIFRIVVYASLRLSDECTPHPPLSEY